MHTFINSPLQIGSLTLPHRLIQGPLAGYSCAPFRELFNFYTPPAYCVSEMSSAIDILHKHSSSSRYIYRAPAEKHLAYQISGNEPHILAEAAAKLQSLGADIIDINCGCPKIKIRKKGAGSALLEDPQKLIAIISKVRAAISIPLTIKIRIQNNEKDLTLAKQIEDAGANALIVHGRRWTEDYDIPCNWHQIANIKNAINIPVVVNGDISDIFSLRKAMKISACDGFMISRAGTGKPWLYQDLLNLETNDVAFDEKLKLFMLHLEGLSRLENEHKAVLQSKSLVRYYFKKQLNEQQLQQFYHLDSLMEIKDFLAAAAHRVSPY
ncbi:TPA: tRNA-dihydrouridine synthase family protein [Legionella pneumophila]|uniref:tRNA dihydrouridine synthase n=1 Tax=Legionella pneumophila TaxID=446 RepID=UPI00078719C9|nr:tRNA-dihydrouridine synthase family protein [Legionella pneumophila]MDW8878669.1 tRNA-dihydrouridine synthase family protein [Legionella pneumophila subsp. fraseri]MDW8963017.1 tRNA-dihydrouridine synthase family protein [Legionella pneumophila subsp. fraseri]MDW9035393.1 tRNA-dihydrouridine synthase family protein [Legionella pneumophila subsp. fraseri]MDW9038454.1 tRNA-dihydrouridine synthase family protein [Legionella pneumophila subsp. fraseri]MDW9041515.1 tRNA-dihydrouridine synthase f